MNNDLENRLSNSALAFRGYNQTNLGRTDELLAHPAYAHIMHRELSTASLVASECLGRKVDLVARVEQGQETTLAEYGDAIALVVAAEQAQVAILREVLGIEYQNAKVALGYSLGEISALVTSQVISLEEALLVPLTLAKDCVELAEGVTLGVAFSRGDPLDLEVLEHSCIRISAAGHGVIGVSAHLSPNSVLIMGQRDTLKRLRVEYQDRTSRKIAIKQDTHQWPPLHTNITWQKNLPDRASVLMQGLSGGFRAPEPDVISLVSGSNSYTEWNARDILRRWIDHPQKLWDALFELLSLNVETVIHVGPQPNIIPATLKRLRDNVESQTKGSIGMRALSAVVDHPWLKHFLPTRTALLRVLSVQEIVLEDWLLEQEVAA